MPSDSLSAVMCSSNSATWQLKRFSATQTVTFEADGNIMKALAQSLPCEVRIWRAANEALQVQPADWQ